MSFEVNPDSLLQAGGALSDVARELQERWRSAVSQIESLGDIFGDDDVGSLIGMSYWAAHAIAGESYDSIVAGLDWFGSGLRTMGERHAANEDEVTGLFRGPGA